jgi:hypothetical protein
MKLVNTINNRQLFGFSSIFAIFLVLLLVITGCENSPFSPSAKMIVSDVGGQLLSPTVSTNDSGEVTVQLADSSLTIHLIQGTGVFVDSYSIQYYDSNEIEINNGAFTQTGKLSGYLTKDTDLTLTIPVYSRAIYDYAHTQGETKPSDGLLTDKSPIIAIVTIIGTDANSNRVSCTGYVTLTTIPASLSSSS